MVRGSRVQIRAPVKDFFLLTSRRRHIGDILNCTIYERLYPRFEQTATFKKHLIFSHVFLRVFKRRLLFSTFLATDRLTKLADFGIRTVVLW